MTEWQPHYAASIKAKSEQALRLAMFVCAFITKDVYREGPTDEDLGVLANHVAETESDQVRLDEEQVKELLRVTITGDTTAMLPPEDVPPLAIVTGGHLLCAFWLDGQHWWQYLGNIWKHVLVTPDPS